MHWVWVETSKTSSGSTPVQLEEKFSQNSEMNEFLFAFISIIITLDQNTQ